MARVITRFIKNISHVLASKKKYARKTFDFEIMAGVIFNPKISKEVLFSFWYTVSKKVLL